MNSKQHTGLIAFGSMALLYWLVSFWGLSPAFESPTASPHLSPKWMFVFSSFILLVDLSIWSVLVQRWSMSTSVRLHRKKMLLSAFKNIAAVIFVQLIPWFQMLLAIVLKVTLPSMELWFVAMALAWMVTPFASLGWISIGTRLGSWLERMRGFLS